MDKKKSIVIVSLFIFSVFIGCCTFPVLNFTKGIGLGLVSILNLGVFLGAYRSIGKAEKNSLNKESKIMILLFNLLAIVIGMGCRYLIEFGEVSNTYNFTQVNIAFHMVAAVTLSSFYCLIFKRRQC